MFEHTKGLKEVDMSHCKEITGKKFLGKFFADQSQGSSPELSSIGDIGVLANCPGLTQVSFALCKKITGKELSWNLL